MITLLLGLALAQDAAPPTAQVDDAAAMLESDAKGAAAAADAILRNPDLTAEHGQAWGVLGAAYHKLGHEYAAAEAFRRGFQADLPGNSEWISTALDAADSVKDEDLLAASLGAAFGAAKDPETKARLALLAARTAFRRGELGLSLGYLALVKSEHAVFADAEVLRGVLLSQQGRHADAQGALQSALQAGQTQDRSERWMETVRMNIARAMYGAGEYELAELKYSEISRNSNWWPQAAFEGAWSEFRAAQFNKSIASLHSLDAPWFDDWYFPEADMLRAQALYMLCLYGEVGKRIDQFNEHYTPILEQFNQLSTSMDPTQAWEEATSWDEGEHKLPEMFLRRYANNERLADAELRVNAARSNADEIAGLPQGEALATALHARADLTIRTNGQAVIADLSAQADDLKDILQGLEVARIDLLSMESDMYQQAATTGKVEDPEAEKEKWRQVRASGKRVWPYQGEWWADELGWYVVDAVPVCPIRGGS